jgi:hypothetical protein
VEGKSRINRSAADVRDWQPIGYSLTEHINPATSKSAQAVQAAFHRAVDDPRQRRLRQTGVVVVANVETTIEASPSRTFETGGGDGYDLPRPLFLRRARAAGRHDDHFDIGRRAAQSICPTRELRPPRPKAVSCPGTQSAPPSTASWFIATCRPSAASRAIPRRLLPTTLRPHRALLNQPQHIQRIRRDRPSLTYASAGRCPSGRRLCCG